jgi:hypothetical protein
MIKTQTNTPKDVSQFVRGLLLSIYGDPSLKLKIPCYRTYSESYNEGKSWRYKWYTVYDLGNNDTYVKMVNYTNEVLKPRMETLFKVSVNLKMLNGSLILIAKPVK